MTSLGRARQLGCGSSFAGFAGPGYSTSVTSTSWGLAATGETS
jgi:hypothetical protein